MGQVFSDTYKSDLITLTNGGLTMTISGGSAYTSGSARGNRPLDPTKKLYFELLLTTPNDGGCDIGIVSENYTSFGFLSGSNYSAYRYDLQWDFAEALPAAPIYYSEESGASPGDVLMCAVDMPNGAIWFGLNGTWKGSGAPATGTNPVFSSQDFTTNDFYLAAALAMGGSAQDSVATLRTDASEWSYTAPTGFEAPALPTYNGALDDAYHAQRLSVIPRGTVLQTAPTRGAAALTVFMPALAAYGAGQAALTVPMPALTASGAIATGAAARLTVPMPAMTAAGYQPNRGAAQLTVPLLTLAARAGRGTPAALAAPVPLLTGAGNGYVAPQGGAALTAPMARMWAQAQASRFNGYVLRHQR